MQKHILRFTFTRWVNDQNIPDFIKTADCQCVTFVLFVSFVVKLPDSNLSLGEHLLRGLEVQLGEVAEPVWPEFRQEVAGLLLDCR